MSDVLSNAQMTENQPGWLPYVAVEAVGQWVGLLTCERCGATVTLQRNVDTAAIHDAWHMSNGVPDGSA